jgi:hypothetical protein
MLVVRDRGRGRPRRLGVALETCVPAEGVEQERVEVVAEEPKDKVQERDRGLGTRDWRRMTGRRDKRGDLGGRGVEQEGQRVEPGRVEARSSGVVAGAALTDDAAATGFEVGRALVFKRAAADETPA